MPISLIIEDGAMPTGANVYADIAYADGYLASRGVSAWADADDDTKLAALVRAADTLNSYRWKGITVAPGRIMAWPRKGMAYAEGTPVPDNIVPAQVANAQCELAGSILADEADPLAPVNTSQGAVVSEKVDVIAVSYAAPDTNAYSGKTGYPAVDALLRPFLAGGSGKFGIVEMERG
jgi:hypothetical protein